MGCRYTGGRRWEGCLTHTKPSAWKRTWAVGFLIVLFAPGCTTRGATSTTASPTTTQVQASTTTAPPPVLVVWADETRAPVVQEAGEAFTRATGALVEVAIFPFRQIRDEVLARSATGEELPDIFLDSNEGTGDLAEAGVIAPLYPAGRAAGFFPVTIDAFRYEGEVYAVPFAFEAIGLIYNKSLVTDPPSDFEELKAICRRLGYPAGFETPCLGLPPDPLHQFPFLSAFGAYLFGSAGAGYVVGEVGLDAPAAVAGAVFLDALYREGYADGTVDYGTMADSFNQDRLPFLWTGPWQLGAVQGAGVDYGVAKLPAMDGNTPRPFVGAQGFFVTNSSQHPDLAAGFLLDYVATTETMLKLFEVTGRAPALRSAADVASADPDVATFLASGLDGDPLPNVPNMDLVWSELVEAFTVIDLGTYGETYTDASGNPATGPPDPAATLRQAAEAIRQVYGG